MLKSQVVEFFEGENQVIQSLKNSLNTANLQTGFRKKLKKGIHFILSDLVSIDHLVKLIPNTEPKNITATIKEFVLKHGTETERFASIECNQCKKEIPVITHFQLERQNTESILHIRNHAYCTCKQPPKTLHSSDIRIPNAKASPLQTRVLTNV